MSNLANLIAAAKNRASMMVVDPAVAEEKAAKLAEREAAKAKKQAEKEAAKEAKRLEREAKKAAKVQEETKVPHMAKIEKAAEKLPELNEQEGEVWVLANQLDCVSLSKVMAHLELKYKALSTETSVGMKFDVGSTVQFVAGNSDRLGKIGVIVESKRIHARVIVAETEKEVACYLSDLMTVEVQTEEESEVSEG